MKTIRDVSIVGAGAMGAAYASMFTDARGFSVTFLARGERHERLKTRIFAINGKDYHFPVVHADRIPAPADLVLVALKHHHLAGAVEDIRALVGENTVILSVMNGLESEAIIGEACGMDKLVHAISVGIDAVHENGRYTYANPGKIIFGRVDDDGVGPSLERIAEALDRANIPNEVPEDILRALWWKFMINVGINQASAVLGAPYRVFQSSAHARSLMRSLMEEVVNLAIKLDIGLTDTDLDAWETILMELSPTGKTSMLQDVEAKRKTEVAVFAGRVIALGREHGIPTPVNETIYKIIRVMEECFGL